ncbi:hypothetical protein Csa_023743 [Cucumis sativus]|nr:hypothetical protein Csa_023743 [Cucumis sativus]
MHALHFIPHSFFLLRHTLAAAPLHLSTIDDCSCSVHAQTKLSTSRQRSNDFEASSSSHPLLCHKSPPCIVDQSRFHHKLRIPNVPSQAESVLADVPPSADY